MAAVKKNVGKSKIKAGKPGRRVGSPQTKPTVAQMKTIYGHLKPKALAGDIQATLALSNLLLSESLQKKVA